MMPGDLSGKVGVRLDFAARGLVGLMGIQVDPYYGSDSEDESERLYFRVVNMGNEPIRLERGDGVFNIELHDATGACKPTPSRDRRVGSNTTTDQESKRSKLDLYHESRPTSQGYRRALAATHFVRHHPSRGDYPWGDADSGDKH